MSKSANLKENAFDYIRMISAALIVIGHSIMHLELNNIPIISDIVWPGLFALFTISGFLIPTSFEHSRNSGDYLKKRFFRLYPGLLCAFIVSLTCVLIIGGGKD